MNAFFDWSLKVFRTSATEYRLHWTVLVVLLFAVVDFSHAHAVPSLGLVIPGILASLWIFGWVQIAAARLLGGQATSCSLWCLGSRIDSHIALTPSKQFFISVIGIFFSGLISLLTYLIVTLVFGPPDLAPLFIGAFMCGKPFPTGIGPWADLLYNLLIFNVALTLWNLLPNSVFCGSRLWRASLWPLMGLAKSVQVTAIAGIFSSVAVLSIGAWITSPLMFLFGMFLLVASILEQRSIRAGMDPVLPVDLDSWQERGTKSWLQSWREQRRRTREQRQEREESSEQEVLDRLLAKVTEHGLPSLSDKERALLQRISKKQRARQETGAR